MASTIPLAIQFHFPGHLSAFPVTHPKILIKEFYSELRTPASPAGGHNSELLLQVHDELVFECPKSEAEKAKKIIKEEMEKALELKVPVKVEIGAGKNWAEAKD